MSCTPCRPWLSKHFPWRSLSPRDLCGGTAGDRYAAGRNHACKGLCRHMSDGSLLTNAHKASNVVDRVRAVATLSSNGLRAEQRSLELPCCCDVFRCTYVAHSHDGWKLYPWLLSKARRVCSQSWYTCHQGKTLGSRLHTTAVPDSHQMHRCAH